jgi:NAD(P)-dependent dehydrogenase (short-subunit alcohol dehydrogenase family)
MYSNDGGRSEEGSGMRLSSKTAIVTGGASGIGRGIALRLAAEGADIVIADIDETAAQQTRAEIETTDRRALVTVTDVSSQAQVEAMVERARRFGGIDILVNNAGIEYVTPLFDVEEAEWDRILAINLKGTFLCCQAVARAMIEDNRRGKIINLGSTAGLSPGKVEPHYVASKAGVHGLTKHLALALAEHRINVNTIAPGATRNGLGTRHSLADPVSAERVKQGIPWGRVATPLDIANAVLFLASDEAAYITGIILPVDGGRLLTKA